MKSYFGHAHNWMDCETLAAARIRPDLSAQESNLFKTKWFDYRVLHPVKATYLYAARYQEVVELLYARTKDQATASSVRAFTPADVFQCSELVSFYRARQELDQLGVRYEFALRFAMNRFTDRGWKFFPRPNQMLGEELLLDIRDAWKIECATRLQAAKDPSYLACEFRGEADQIAYQKWLVKQVMTRPHPYMSLATLINDGQIVRAFAESVFDKRTYAEALKLAAMLG